MTLHLQPSSVLVHTWQVTDTRSSSVKTAQIAVSQNTCAYNHTEVRNPRKKVGKQTNMWVLQAAPDYIHTQAHARKHESVQACRVVSLQAKALTSTRRSVQASQK